MRHHIFIILGIVLVGLPSLAFPPSGSYDALAGGTVNGSPLIGPATLTVDEQNGTATFTSPNFVEQVLVSINPLVIEEVPFEFPGVFLDADTLQVGNLCVITSLSFEGTEAILGDWTLEFDGDRFEWVGQTTTYSDADCTSLESVTTNTNAFMALQAATVPATGPLPLTLLIAIALAGLFWIVRR